MYILESSKQEIQFTRLNIILLANSAHVLITNFVLLKYSFPLTSLNNDLSGVDIITSSHPLHNESRDSRASRADALLLNATPKFYENVHSVPGLEVSRQSARQV